MERDAARDRAENRPTFDPMIYWVGTRWHAMERDTTHLRAYSRFYIRIYAYESCNGVARVPARAREVSK